MFKVLRIITLIFVLLLSSAFAFADDSIEDNWLESEETEAVFTDVNQGEWFYEAVMTMNKLDIISGYPDGTFKPLKAVSREEFAAMMVRALNIELKESNSSFVDISDDYWASKYIESAKSYITGYKLNDEYYFKPKEDAVREDMAVSLVRALSKKVGGDSIVGLDDYADKDLVSKNLYDYVASAIYNNLMVGYLEDEIKYFKPMDTLTRAQAAALLLSVVKEEKIVFEEEEKEVVVDEDKIVLEFSIVEGGVKLDWDLISDKEVLEYKIIASKEKSNPTYLVDGYAKSVELSSTIIYNGDTYNNGDFGEFVPEEEYYFEVVAITSGDEIVSNTLSVQMPEAIDTEGKVPEIRVSQLGDGILIEWDEVITTGLQGYKIIASKYDETPTYPESGYAEWITDLNVTSYFIEPYSKYLGGDFGEAFKPGETYYLSIVAVYHSGKVAGNTVTYIMPGDLESVINKADRTPVVSAEVVDNYLRIHWSELPKDNLSGYKIVASKNNSNPAYPEDGYAFWITDLDVYSETITAGTSYSGGDFYGEFIAGEEYYINVTAVYNDESISGNAILARIPN